MTNTKLLISSPVLVRGNPSRDALSLVMYSRSEQAVSLTRRGRGHAGRGSQNRAVHCTTGQLQQGLQLLSLVMYLRRVC